MHILDGGIFQNHCSCSLKKDGALICIIVISGIFQLPAITTLVVEKFWIVVSFVEILENAGEDLRLLVREIDAFVVCFQELLTTAGLEERRHTEDVLVGGKETLVRTDTDRNDRRGQ